MKKLVFFATEFFLILENQIEFFFLGHNVGRMKAPLIASALHSATMYGGFMYEDSCRPYVLFSGHDTEKHQLSRQIVEKKM